MKRFTENIIQRFRSRLPYIGLLALLPVLGGCAAAPEASTAAGNAGGDGLHPLTVMLDWYPNAVHSFLYAAEENGYFEDEGLAVNIEMPAATNDALKLVAAGQADLALSYQPQVLMARAEQIPVKSVAALVRHPLNHLLVPQDGQIKRPKDLAGKTAGFSSIPLYEAMLQTMVEFDGGDPSAVSLIDVGYDLIPAISAGRVDGIIGGFINHEALILEKEGVPMQSFDPTEYGVPDYYELVLTASEQGLEDRQDEIAAFLRAAGKGQQFVAEHPQEALDLLLKRQDATAPLDAEIEAKSLDLLLPLMDAGDQPFGYQDPQSWEQVGAWLKENGLISSDVDPKASFINL